MAVKIEPGTRFGRGTVIREVPVVYPNRPDRTERGLYLECDCGAEYVSLLTNVLRSHEAVSGCGCRGKSWSERLLRRRMREMAAEAGYEVVQISMRPKQ